MAQLRHKKILERKLISSSSPFMRGYCLGKFDLKTTLHLCQLFLFTKQQPMDKGEGRRLNTSGEMLIACYLVYVTFSLSKEKIIIKANIYLYLPAPGDMVTIHNHLLTALAFLQRLFLLSHNVFRGIKANIKIRNICMCIIGQRHISTFKCPNPSLTAKLCI